MPLLLFSRWISKCVEISRILSDQEELCRINRTYVSIRQTQICHIDLSPNLYILHKIKHLFLCMFTFDCFGCWIVPIVSVKTQIIRQYKSENGSSWHGSGEYRHIYNCCIFQKWTEAIRCYGHCTSPFWTDLAWNICFKGLIKE